MRVAPILKEGDDDHIKGFIINKLYLDGCWIRPGGKHGKHTSIDNLPKGYSPRYRGKFKGIIKELKKEGLICPYPSTKEEHICAVLNPALIDVGLRLCNAYRKAVGLPPLDQGFREILEKTP